MKLKTRKLLRWVKDILWEEVLYDKVAIKCTVIAC